jgi:hypothetical protein
VLEVRVVELRMAHFYIDDNFHTLRISNLEPHVRMKHLAKVIGIEDLPSPPPS